VIKVRGVLASGATRSRARSTFDSHQLILLWLARVTVPGSFVWIKLKLASPLKAVPIVGLGSLRIFEAEFFLVPSQMPALPDW
jgi:hypothetical protein